MAISDGKIVAVGRVPERKAKRTIKTNGLIVASASSKCTRAPTTWFSKTVALGARDRLCDDAMPGEERVGGPAAMAGMLGDSFQYVIDHPVTLARQKSAMLPIFGKDIDCRHISIYTSMQAKHPLCGMRLKNTTDLPPKPGGRRGHPFLDAGGGCQLLRAALRHRDDGTPRLAPRRSRRY